MPSQPKFVLIVAHGSRAQASNEHFAQLVARVRRRAGDGARIGHAYLEMAEPDIPGGLDALREQGAREILLLPYFLSPGRHVGSDIPQIAKEYGEAHPGVYVEVLSYFGSDVEIITEMLGESIGATDAQGGNKGEEAT